MLGSLAQIFFDFTGRRTDTVLRRFAYTRTTLLGFLLFVLGVAAEVQLVYSWIRNDFTLPEELSEANSLAATGLFLMIAGFSLFVFTLFFHAASLAIERGAVRARAPDGAGVRWAHATRRRRVRSITAPARTDGADVRLGCRLIGTIAVWLIRLPPGPFSAAGRTPVM
jgi:hypothetical protein